MTIMRQKSIDYLNRHWPATIAHPDWSAAGGLAGIILDIMEQLMGEKEALGNVTRVSLKPGDKLVAIVSEDTDQHHIKKLAEALTRVFKDNQVMVTSKPMQFLAIGEDKVEPTQTGCICFNGKAPNCPEHP